MTSSKRKRAVAQVPEAILIEGLDADAEHASDMGVYELVDGSMVHSRRVWRQLSEQPATRTSYLYYSLFK